MRLTGTITFQTKLVFPKRNTVKTNSAVRWVVPLLFRSFTTAEKGRSSFSIIRVHGTLHPNRIQITYRRRWSGAANSRIWKIQSHNNSGTETDALGRVFPYGTVMDPAATRSIAAGAVDPVYGLTNSTNPSIYVRDPFFTGGSIRAITNFTGLAPELNQLPAARLDPNAIRLLQLYRSRQQLLSEPEKS